MGIFFKSKRNIKNTSDNHITISTSADIMFKIGKDLGEIKYGLKHYNSKMDNVYKILNDYKKRIERLENEKNI